MADKPVPTGFGAFCWSQVNASGAVTDPTGGTFTLFKGLA